MLLVGVSCKAICENIPNIEVSLEKVYSETTFWAERYSLADRLNFTNQYVN